MPLAQLILSRLILSSLGLLTYLGIEVNFQPALQSENLKEKYEEAAQDVANILSDHASSTEPAPVVIIAEQPKEPVATKTPVIAPAPAPQQPKPVILPVIKPIEVPLPIVIPTPEPTPTPVPEPIPEPQPEPEPVKEEPSTATRNPEKAVVRVSCVNQIGNAITIASGSGVLVDPSGVIMTNAHVAYPFTLTDEPGFNYSCQITQANIPTFGYTAEPIYISRSWIREYGDNFKQGSLPTNTGEGDLALLKITGTTNPAMPYPSSFPYLEATITDIDEGDSVQTIGYPAAGSGDLLTDLSNALVSDETDIAGAYSFDGSGIHVLSTEATSTARPGSSGGAVVSDGRLIGIIVTSSGNGSRATLTALTMEHAQDVFSGIHPLPFSFRNR